VIAIVPSTAYVVEVRLPLIVGCGTATYEWRMTRSTAGCDGFRSKRDEQRFMARQLPSLRLRVLARLRADHQTCLNTTSKHFEQRGSITARQRRQGALIQVDEGALTIGPSPQRIRVECHG
jgi:hypothetical protein